MTSADHQGEDREPDEFDAIVARLREEGWTDATDEPAPSPPHEAPDPIASLPSQWRTPPTDSASVLDEVDEFVPEEPAPLPSGDLGFWGALAGLAGGILWLLYLFFFDREARTIWWVLAILTTLAGLVMVFLRQPERRDDGWDDDVDGAVL